MSVIVSKNFSKDITTSQSPLFVIHMHLTNLSRYPSFLHSRSRRRTPSSLTPSRTTSTNKMSINSYYLLYFSIKPFPIFLMHLSVGITFGSNQSCDVNRSVYSKAVSWMSAMDGWMYNSILI